ncbi:phospholipid carrier-dependent glycosyltransferase [Desulfococcaceae bacterium HSG9]|nr:phospholipid carrier-dependent glycosyltransferase [Desulfococcaceae bacterium HSG9]
MYKLLRTKIKNAKKLSQSMNSISRKSTLDLTLAILIFIASFSYLYYGSKSVHFHPDEAHKISETYYYHLFFNGDVANTDWHNDFYARTNPPVGKYIMGALLDIQGHKITSLDLQCKFEALWQKPTVLLNHISTEVIFDARLISVFFGAFVCLCIYILGTFSGNQSVGTVAALLLLFNPLFKIYCSMAMTDSILMAFMTLSILISLIYIHSASKILRHAQLYSQKQIHGRLLIFGTILPGVIIALATGTKLNGALAGFQFLISAAGCAFMLLFTKKNENPIPKRYIRFLFGYAVLGVGLSIFLFISINPYLYSDAFIKLFQTLTVYKDWMQKQMLHPGEPLFLWQQKVATVVYYQFIFSELPLCIMKQSVNISLGFILFSIGLTFTVKIMWKKLKQRQLPMAEFIGLVWLTVYGIGITFWIPVTWPRYILPLSPVCSWFMALGLCAMVRSLIQIVIKIANTYRNHESIKQSAIIYAMLKMALAAIILLLLYSGFVKLESLPPRTISEFGFDKLDKLYCNKQSSEKLEANLLFNHGDLMMRSKSFDKAVSLYEQGLKLAAQEKQRKLFFIKSLSIEYKLVNTFIALGHYHQAANFLNNHIKKLSLIKEQLKTNDLKIKSEFDNLIDSRTNLLLNLRNRNSKNKPVK